MPILRWNPTKDFLTIQEKINKIFEDEDSFSNPDFSPAVDIIEQPDAITLYIELSGMSEEDINIQVTEGVISISGNRNQIIDDSSNDNDLNNKAKANYFLLERKYGRFSRSFAIPTGIGSSDVTALLKDGLLKIALKKRAKKTSRTLQIIETP